MLEQNYNYVLSDNIIFALNVGHHTYSEGEHREETPVLRISLTLSIVSRDLGNFG